MKIHIVCGPLYPQLHPRAFRYTELAKEFVRMGHKVAITSYMAIEGFDYDDFAKKNGISKITQMALYTSKSIGNAKVVKNSKLRLLSSIRYNITEYLLGGSTLFRSRYIADHLDIDDDVDMIIAGSTPFMSILGTSYFLKRHKFKKNCVLIADSGDPYYYSPQSKLGPWFKTVERDAYNQYDYLAIPTDTAIPCYNKLIPESKIRIIPQGFDMQNLNLYKGEFGKPVKFAYSGVFYWNIRNPEFLFAYLDKTNKDFEFHLFMRYADPVFTSMLEKYGNLKGKTKIVTALGRDELLYELSKMDFLINVDNLSSKQIPSKLIDYGIVKRPIFNCNVENFDSDKLDDYLDCNFHDSYEIDVAKFDIKNVAAQFIELYEEKQYK